MLDISILPTVNALLNLTTAVLLVSGFLLIRRKNIPGHKICMLAATLTSTVFLVSYLYYHAHHGITRFLGQGWIRSLYFFILTTHTILAAVQVPLIILTLVYAFRGRFDKHIRLARVTLPIWLYVSVTGVAVYWILYRMNIS